MQRAHLVATAAFLLAMAGCAGAPAASPPPSGAQAEEGTAWAKADGSYAAYGEFERADAACGGSEGVLPNVSAARGSHEDYTACMKAQGWVLVRVP